MTSFEPIGASFRDPSGTVFAADGVIYRQVNRSYQKQYDQLMQGGLYADLLGRGLLISHEEVGHELLKDPGVYKVLQPRQLRLVSYPYEWSFSQLQDAALLTLDVQRRCLAHDMILKDASAYNVQFLAGKALFIDSLSFERYQPGQAWHAYEQFCQHFLAPLALMSYRDVRLSQLLRVHLDGIPLDLAVALLPRRSWLNFGLGLHLRLHARAQRRYRGAEAPAANARRKRLSKKDLLNIAKDLRSTIAGLRWDYQQTGWAGYY
ncbi:MAG: SAM-dependent methyltransferase, partial [Chloroflexi bacterium]|nr:SAM-dependent methyltransferase [Chloroflexota bacterium]